MTDYGDGNLEVSDGTDTVKFSVLPENVEVVPNNIFDLEVLPGNSRYDIDLEERGFSIYVNDAYLFSNANRNAAVAMLLSTDTLTIKKKYDGSNYEAWDGSSTELGVKARGNFQCSQHDLDGNIWKFKITFERV